MMRWVLAATLVANPLGAQQDSLMREAVRLATEGFADSAQAIVRSRLAQVRPTDPRFPEVLYTAGVVADRADSARAYFRRVSIEYSGSAWADRSMLRIAQLAYSQGDLDAAQRAAENLLIDYPFSEVRAGAAFLLAQLHLDRRDVLRGCEYLDQAQREAAGDVELANRAAFYIQRCEQARARPAEPEPADSTEPSGPVTYAVQVAAVSSVAATDELMRGLARAGYTAEVVREGELFKVRVGRFRRREDATALRDELKERMGGDPFVVERR